MPCTVDEEDWKEMGLREWEKGSTEGASPVEGFACAAEPVGWTFQGARVLTIQTSKDKKYF